MSSSGDDKPIKLNLLQRLIRDLSVEPPKPLRTNEDFLVFILEKNASSCIWEFAFNPKSLDDMGFKKDHTSYRQIFDIHFDLDIWPNEEFSVSEDLIVLGRLIFRFAEHKIVGIVIIGLFRSVMINGCRGLNGDGPVFVYIAKHTLI